MCVNTKRKAKQELLNEVRLNKRIFENAGCGSRVKQITSMLHSPPEPVHLF